MARKPIKRKAARDQERGCQLEGYCRYRGSGHYLSGYSDVSSLNQQDGPEQVEQAGLMPIVTRTPTIVSLRGRPKHRLRCWRCLTLPVSTAATLIRTPAGLQEPIYGLWPGAFCDAAPLLPGRRRWQRPTPACVPMSKGLTLNNSEAMFSQFGEAGLWVAGSDAANGRFPQSRQRQLCCLYGRRPLQYRFLTTCCMPTASALPARPTSSSTACR
jgi:hypothetical protein